MSSSEGQSQYKFEKDYAQNLVTVLQNEYQVMFNKYVQAFAELNYLKNKPDPVKLDPDNLENVIKDLKNENKRITDSYIKKVQKIKDENDSVKVLLKEEVRVLASKLADLIRHLFLLNFRSIGLRYLEELLSF